jgi:uncharacterized protein YndB with AHSA1/START domain
MSVPTVVATPSDREIVITRAFAAPRTLLWEAWTRPEHLPRWMLGPEGWTMPVCEVDLRPGGARRSVWRRADGTELGMRGVYREVAPPGRLVFTESYDFDPEGLHELLVTLELAEADGGTALTQRILYASREARDLELTRVPDGASVSFDRLEGYLHALLPTPVRARG